MKKRSVADVEGAWQQPDLESSLIQCCRESWSVPVVELSDRVLATFLRQRLAISLVEPEACRRVSANIIDDTEIYDGELAAALSELRNEK